MTRKAFRHQSETSNPRFVKADLCVCVNRMMWAAGAVAAMSSITFPAVSALVSQSADPDKQGESLSLLVPSVSTRSPLLC